MTLKERVDNLENLILSFIKQQDNTDKYINTEINVCKNTENNQKEEIDINTSDISDNREGITEAFESTLANADDVAINREAIEELYEMIAEREV